MVAKEKLYLKLDLLEAELQERLIPHLEQSALGKNDLVFCVSGFNTVKELKSKTDKLTEDLVELGAQILLLKNKLGEPSAGSVAERICWYCRKWSTIQNNQRNAAQELATQFLNEILNGP